MCYDQCNQKPLKKLLKAWPDLTWIFKSIASMTKYVKLASFVTMPLINPCWCSVINLCTKLILKLKFAKVTLYARYILIENVISQDSWQVKYKLMWCCIKSVAVIYPSINKLLTDNTHLEILFVYLILELR